MGYYSDGGCLLFAIDLFHDDCGVLHTKGYSQPQFTKSRNKPDRQLNRPRTENLEIVRIQVDEFDSFIIISTDVGSEEVSTHHELVKILKRIRIESDDEELDGIGIEAHVDSTHGAVVAALGAGREVGFSKFKMMWWNPSIS